MPPPVNPEVPREMAARHRRERKALRAEYGGDIDVYLEQLKQLWDRQRREREESFSPGS